MHKIYLFFLFLLAFNAAQSQGENCSGAVLLTNGGCVTGSPGFSQSIVGCVGNADDDVWYKFVATAASHSLTVTGSSSYDAVLQFFSGTCSGLISGGCVDNSLTGQAESMTVSGLTIGNTYYVRVYHYYLGSGGGNFSMCLNNAPPTPLNDNCNNAINLTVNAGCFQTSGSTYGATPQAYYSSCSGNANDDVWYTFTATNYTQTIQVAGSANMDAVIEVFSGSCSFYAPLSCTDNTFSGGTETVIATGLVPGAQYFFRVYDYYAAAGSTFSVCVSGNNIIPGTQPNDDPCGAILLPVVTADCNYSTFSNVGATLSGSAPAPTSCSGGTGGFLASSKDVWFAITVPANGNLCITPEPNLTGAVITDGVMALYSGSCNSLSQITCSDDGDGTGGIYNYPGTANDFLPYINAKGLVPGTTVYLRYWGWGSSSGAFGICVSSPTNDNCANALYICDLNGYSSSTNAAYTPDWPSNMKGDAETVWVLVPAPPHYQFVPGNTPSGGIFGLGGSWGVGQPYAPSPPCVPYAYDVQIDNNSWLKFTAASTVASFSVTVSDCWLGGCLAGIQMQIFSAVSACTTFTPVSDFRQSASSFSISANGLVVGQDYYVMVDGWGGDICNYTIKALTGVSFPAITASPPNICPGQSSILTAPSGASGYTWAPTGQNTQTISVSPGTTMTYTCYVGSVCGYKQTLSKTVNMLATPSVSINAGAAISTCGTNTLTLIGSGANTYSWSTGNTAASFTTAPSTNTTYSVTGTSTDGCTNTAVTNVTVNTIPISTTSSTGTITCTTSTVNLNSSLAGQSYTWTAPSGSSISSGVNSQNAVGFGAGTYTLHVVSAAGCTYSTTLSTNINKTVPTAAASNGTLTCAQTSTILTGSPISGVTYNWSGPGILGSTTSANITATVTGNYTLVTTSILTGCSSTVSAIGKVVSNLTTPTVSAGSNKVISCAVPSVTLTGSSTAGSILNWSSGSTTNTTAVGGSGTYSLTATNPVTGCSATATVQVLPSAGTPSGVVGAVTGSITCTNTSVALSITSTVSPLTYSWTGPGTITSPTSSATTVSSGGTFTITITNSASCSQSYPVVVTTNTTPVVVTATLAPSASITCVTSSLTLSAVPTGVNYSYTWTGPNILSGVNSSNPIVGSGGNYSVTVTNTINGCKTTKTVSVAASLTLPTLAVSATSSVITCSIGSSTLNATSNFTPTWITPSGPAVNPLFVNAAGSYTATVTNPSNGCKRDRIVIITNNNLPPNANAGAATAIPCSTNSVALLGTSTTTDAVTYSWNGPQLGSILSGSNTSSPIVTAMGVYTVTVTNGLTGCSQTSTVNVSEGTVIAAFTTDQITGETPLTINFTNSSSGASNYNWTFGNGSYSTLTDPNTIFETEGTYTVILVASSNLCTDTASIVINVEDGFTIEIPNVFTPNGDGANDAFKIKITGVKSAEGAIYNRWGQLLYRFDAINSSWDGKANNGENCPDATYFYIIKVVDKKGKEHLAPGYVLITR